MEHPFFMITLFDWRNNYNLFKASFIIVSIEA